MKGANFFRGRQKGTKHPLRPFLEGRFSLRFIVPEALFLPSALFAHRSEGGAHELRQISGGQRHLIPHLPGGDRHLLQALGRNIYKGGEPFFHPHGGAAPVNISRQRQQLGLFQHFDGFLPRLTGEPLTS
jgi:hypothetical protein